MRYYPHVSPWGLTPAQAAVMDALVEHGTNKAAARVLGISDKTIEQHSTNIGRKMRKHRFRSQRLIAWDRWRRGAAT